MAKIRIPRREAGGESFPRLCMKCGQEADCDVPQTFAWMPSWVHILILLGLLPWLICCLVTRKTMRVVAPMCARHAGHWRVRKLYVWLGLLFWIAYAITIGVVWDDLSEGATGPLMGVGIFGGLIWLVSAALFANSAVKASLIHERGAELVNVSRDFADAWNDVGDDD